MSINYCGIKKNVKEARNLVIDATTDAGSGHPGGSFSMAEIVGTLFGKHLRYDSKNPTWEDRDRLVLSKGHAAPGLFSNLAVAGYFEKSQLLTLRKFGSNLQGHPDLKCPGVPVERCIYCCGGSLGIGYRRCFPNKAWPTGFLPSKTSLQDDQTPHQVASMTRLRASLTFFLIPQ